MRRTMLAVIVLLSAIQTVDAFDNAQFFNKSLYSPVKFHLGLAPCYGVKWDYIYGFGQNPVLGTFGLDFKFSRESVPGGFSFFLSAFLSVGYVQMGDRLTSFNQLVWTFDNISFNLRRTWKLDSPVLREISPYVGIGPGYGIISRESKVLLVDMNNRILESALDGEYFHGVANIGTEFVIQRNLMQLDICCSVLAGSVVLRDVNADFFYSTVMLRIGLELFLF